MTATVSLSPAASSLLQYLQQHTTTNRYSSFSGKVLEAALGICRKSLQRARRALVAAGLLDYHVAGRMVYYRLLPGATGTMSSANVKAATASTDGDTMSMLEAMQHTIAMLEAQLRLCTAELARLQQCVQPEADQSVTAAAHAESAVEAKPAEAKPVTVTEVTSNEDVLFNNRYQQLLEPYLAEVTDPKYRTACMDHFRMLKAAFSRRGKRKMTEAGFHRIMHQLDTLCGTDTELRLAIMARSLRSHWTGFYALPHNTPEQKAMERRALARSAEPKASAKQNYKPAYTHSNRSSGPKYYETDDMDLSIFEE